MAHVAKAPILLGLHGTIAAGQPVPETYEDSLGNEHPTDFKRLVELDLVEATKPKPAHQRRSAKKRS